jgi:hypothetical protein
LARAEFAPVAKFVGRVELDFKRRIFDLQGSDGDGIPVWSAALAAWPFILCGTMRLILADERHGKSSVPKKEALLDFEGLQPLA